MLEEHVFDLLPGYALGSLDEEDILTVARHLPGCAVCRAELAGYCDTVDQLAYSLPLRAPSKDLRAKIIARAEQSIVQNAPSPAPAGVRPAGLEQPLAAPRQRRGLVDFLRGLAARPAGFALGAVAVLLILLLGASSLALWQQINALQSRNEALAQQVAGLQSQVAQDALRLVRMQGTKTAPQARGYLMVFRNETYGTLVVENAPVLKPGLQYQLWLIRDGKRTNGGVFSVNEKGYGTLQISADQPLESFPNFGVTIEPAGGSPGPTGDRVLGGGL